MAVAACSHRTAVVVAAVAGIAPVADTVGVFDVVADFHSSAGDLVAAHSFVRHMRLCIVFRLRSVRLFYVNRIGYHPFDSDASRSDCGSVCASGMLDCCGILRCRFHTNGSSSNSQIA